MARARNIKPGFFRNADLVELPVEARLLFIGLWTIADREGRLKDRPKQIKMEIFPADNYDCNDLIQQIADTGMLVRYEHGGNRYLQITNFTKHQNPHRDEQASTIPAQGTPDAAQAKEPAEVPIPDQITPEKPANAEDAPCIPDACTVQAPCIPDACTEVARLNPESLIPESINIHTSPAKLPPCPADQIVKLYLEALPELPGVRVMVDARKRAIKKRWEWVLSSTKPDGSRRAENAQQAIDWFRDFFELARENDFLMGRTPKATGHTGWTCDIDFLMTDKGLTRVLEKTEVTA